MTQTSIERRHDLDALRAFAMLLGIALHASMSFFGAPWAVQDSQPAPALFLFFAIVHGFRMQLFFLVSGFFTAMMWRRRGVSALVKQRFQRVFVPCMLGLVTILPLLHWVSDWAMQSAKQESHEKAASFAVSPIVTAIRKGDHDSVTRLLNKGADANGRDAEFGITLLAWSAVFDDVQSAQLLIDKGAKIDARNGDGGTPLHAATFLGNVAVANLLIRKGADIHAKNNTGGTPLDSSMADWGTTQYIAGMVRIPLRAKEAILAGREQCQKLLSPDKLPPKPSDGYLGLRASYSALLLSDRLNIRWKPTAEPFHLVATPVFDHLWFLWFLCWFVPIFVMFAKMAEWRGWKGLPERAVLSPLRLYWLLPLTLLAQWFMGVLAPSFGPDTSVGLIPQPHLLLYYGVFFMFGVFYYDCDDKEGRLGRSWKLSLSLALSVAFPLALVTIQSRILSGFAQVLYTWLMVFGLIGLFRHLLKRESKPIRYLSDASYWLYLAHLPFIVLTQELVRKMPLPGGVKFLGVGILVTGVLLVCYDLFVRYTPLGTLLNGRRQREAKGVP